MGVAYFSSVSARRIGSARPKSLNEFNSKSFYVRPDRLARMRAESERGVRDIPRGQGCQCERCWKTGLKTSGAAKSNRTWCAEIVFHAARKQLGESSLCSDPQYMAGCHGVFKANRPAARFGLNRGCTRKSPGAREIADRPVDTTRSRPAPSQAR